MFVEQVLFVVRAKPCCWPLRCCLFRCRCECMSERMVCVHGPNRCRMRVDHVMGLTCWFVVDLEGYVPWVHLPDLQVRFIVMFPGPGFPGVIPRTAGLFTGHCTPHT